MRPTLRLSTLSPPPSVVSSCAPDRDEVFKSTSSSSTFQFEALDLEALYCDQRDAREANEDSVDYPWDREIFNIDGAFTPPIWLKQTIRFHLSPPAAEDTPTSHDGKAMDVDDASDLSSPLSSVPPSIKSSHSKESVDIHMTSRLSSPLSSLPPSMKSSRSSLQSAASTVASLASSAKSLASSTKRALIAASQSVRARVVGSTIARDVCKAMGIRPPAPKNASPKQPSSPPSFPLSVSSLPKNARSQVAKNSAYRAKAEKKGKRHCKRGKGRKKSRQAKETLLGGNQPWVVPGHVRPSKSHASRKRRLHHGFQRKANKVSLSLFDFTLIPIAKSGFMGVRKREGSPVGWSASRLQARLQTFRKFAFDGRPLILMDASQLIFCIRSSVPSFMADLHAEILQVLDWFTADVPSMSHSMNLVRGYFNYYLFGVQCQYSPNPNITSFHKKHRTKFEELMAKTIPGGHKTPPMVRLVGFVNSVLECFAPEVYNRMMAIPTFGHDRPFGAFHLMCINAPGEIVKWVHTHFHIDWKNCPFFCAVYTYAKGPFDHRRKAWLCLWEAMVLIELPPGCVCLYPSALFAHFNVNLADIEVRWTLELEDGTVVWDDEKGGSRGSIVFFTQASMMQRAEHNMSLTAARKAKLEPPSYKAPAPRVYENMKLFMADSGLAAAVYPIPDEIDILSQI